MEISKAEFSKANRRMEQLRKRDSYAVKAYYDLERNRVVIDLANGLGFMFDPAKVQATETANAADLAEIEIDPSGLGIYFPRLDEDVYLLALMEGILGTRKWMAAQLGAKGGQAKTPAKTQASRENGKLGGRPRKYA